MYARSFFVALLMITFFCPEPLPGKSELPYEFGELVPLYPNAQPVDTRYTRDSVSVQFATNESYKRIIDFYAKVLEEAGWRILPATSRGKFKAEKITSGMDEIHLTITEASADQGNTAGFTIDLNYPGGRE